MLTGRQDLYTTPKVGLYGLLWQVIEPLRSLNGTIWLLMDRVAVFLNDGTSCGSAGAAVFQRGRIQLGNQWLLWSSCRESTLL